MIIEIVAIETTGLDASKDRIIEVAVGRLWDAGFSLKHAIIDPEDAELTPEIIAHHTRSGLWADMAKEGRKPLSETTGWLGSSHLRVVWALDFAKGFMRDTPLAPAISGAVDGRAALQLARVCRGRNFGEHMRAVQKVEEMRDALIALRGTP